MEDFLKHGHTLTLRELLIIQELRVQNNPP
jgi:hypothetical protein